MEVMVNDPRILQNRKEKTMKEIRKNVRRSVEIMLGEGFSSEESREDDMNSLEQKLTILIANMDTKLESLAAENKELRKKIDELEDDIDDLEEETEELALKNSIKEKSPRILEKIKKNKERRNERRKRRIRQRKKKDKKDLKEKGKS